MGKVIVAIKPSSSKSGASGVTRYIAESKRDPEKEHLKEKEARPLFSSSQDDLSFQQADIILGEAKGYLPEKEDLIHVVISLEPESFEQLGDTHEERVEAFKEIIREAAKEIETEVAVEELRWAAGIHLNTDNPHVHLAISRQAIDRLTHEPKHIDHLPRTLLPHNEKQADGTKEFKEGLIAAIVNRGLELTREARQHETHGEPDRERPEESQVKDQAPGRDEFLGIVEEIAKPTDTREQSTNQLAEFVGQTVHFEFTDQDGREQSGFGQVIAYDDPYILGHEFPGVVFRPEDTMLKLDNGAILFVQPEWISPIENTHTIAADETAHQPTQEQPALDRTPPEVIANPRAEGLDPHAPDTISELSFDEPETTFFFDESDMPDHRPGSEAIRKERETIGRSMLARAEFERLELELQSISDHGDKRRYRVFDATHGRTRQISEFDIHRRADASAATTVREQTIEDADKRHLVRQIEYETNIHDHHKAIFDHRIIVSKTVKQVARKLNEAEERHAGLKAQVRAIQTQCKSDRRPMPLPLLSRDELAKLQDQAIASHIPTRVNTLENIRQSLALEQDKPSRTDQEIARLEGQLLMSRADQAARHQRAYQFERNKHQTRWEIRGEKYSLAELDRNISIKENRLRLVRFPLNIKSMNLLPSDRHAARDAAAHMKEVREIVIAKISERQQEMAASLKEAVNMTQTLTRIYGREQLSQQAREGTRLDKIVNRSEISHLIEHAATLSDPAMMQQAFLLEAQFNDRQSPGQQPSIPEQAARASGREVMSEIAVREATKKIEAFKEHKDFVPVIITDREGNEVTGRLADFHEPRHPIKWLLKRALETKEERHLRQQVAKAVDNEQTQLKDEHANAQQCHELTKGIADTYREYLHSAGETMPDAIFTTRQIIQLEIYAVRHPDLQERDRIQTLINHAELSRHVFTPQTYDKAQTTTSDRSPHDSLQQDQTRDLQPPDLLLPETPGMPPTEHQRVDPIIGATDTNPAAGPAAAPDSHDLDIIH
jgi:hypothetical protein